jgi:Tol biopolymer transport system component/DNA-binding winged helix-turn-helix (wHTH) protein
VSANIRTLRPPDQTRFARLGDWLIDLASNRLLRAERELRPTPKAMAVLRQLMLAGGAPLSRSDLLDTVWRDAYPTDDVLTHAITELRRALEDDPKVPRFIETIPKVGYRLISPVEWLEQLPGNDAGAAEAMAERVESPMRPPVALAGALLLLVAIAVVGPLLTPRPAPSPRLLRAGGILSGIALPVRPVTAESNSERFPSISPDGSSVAYSARYPGDDGTRIYLRGLSGSPPIRLSRAEASDETYPVWSPDGTQIAFVRFSGEECHIVVVAALGGHEREVTGCAPRIVDYMDWTANGKALVVSRYRRSTDRSGETRFEGPSSLHLLGLDDGRLTALKYAHSVSQPDVQPRVSPDGRRIAFRRGAAPYSDLFVVPSDGGEPRQLTRLRARIRGYDWLPNGRHLLMSSDHAGIQALYLVDADSGELVPLGFNGASFPAVSRGRAAAVFQQDNADINLQSFRLDAAPDAAGEGIASSTRFEAWPAYAPDDDRLVFVSDRGGDSQLWLLEPGARTSYQLTHHDKVELASPNWSPDGRRVLYVARGAGTSRLLSVEVDSGQTRQESEEGDNARFGTYSADGKSILFVSDRDGMWRVWERRIDRNEVRPLSKAGAYNAADPGNGTIYFAHLSEDGLYGLDIATGEERRVSSAIQYWNMNAWRADRGGLYYLYGSDEMRLTLYFEPWSGGPPQILRQIDGAIGDPTFTLDREHARAVAPVVARDDTDVMLLDLSPIGGM